MGKNDGDSHDEEWLPRWRMLKVNMVKNDEDSQVEECWPT